MPSLTVLKTYQDGTIPTEVQIDDVKSSIETFLNTTKLDSSNIQTGAVGLAQLAPASVTANKYATGSVTTAKLNPNIITKDRFALTANYVISPACTFTTNSTTMVPVTNLTCTITTGGHPVLLFLQPAPTLVGQAFVASAASGEFAVFRGSTMIFDQRFASTNCSPVMAVDIPGAGTYTYTVQVLTATGNTLNINNWQFVAVELLT